MSSRAQVLVLEADSLGAAYRVLDFFSTTSTELISLIPSAKRSTLVLQTTETQDKIVSLLTNWEADLSWKIFSTPAEELLAPFLGLQFPPLKGDLIIFESESPLAAFSAAEGLLQAKFQVLDLRIQKGARLGAHVLASGAGSLPLDSSSTGLWTRLEKPGALVRQLFENQVGEEF